MAYFCQDPVRASIESAAQSASGLDIAATSREDDKTSCSRTASVVSSLGESDGPAEWSVDEMDDGDTLFLVTSSEKEELLLPPGAITLSRVSYFRIRKINLISVYGIFHKIFETFLHYNL